jgi:hypothetical protein
VVTLFFPKKLWTGLYIASETFIKLLNIRAVMWFTAFVPAIAQL